MDYRLEQEWREKYPYFEIVAQKFGIETPDFGQHH